MNRRPMTSLDLKRKQAARRKKLARQRVIAASLCAFIGAVSFFAVRAMLNGGPTADDPSSTRPPAAASGTRAPSDALPPIKNVYVDGIDISSMTEAEALRAVNAANEARMSAMKLTITGGGGQWTIGPEDIGAKTDAAAAVEKAMAVGRTGTTADKREAIKKLESQPYRGETKLSYDDKLLVAAIQRIADELAVPAQDATMAYTPGESKPFSVVPEIQGVECDAAELTRKARDLLDAGGGGTLAASLRAVKPALTVADLQKAQTEIITVSTSLKNSTENRNFNIGRALAHFNGLVIPPGEEVSFNDLVGPRTEENGYRTAKVILNDDFVDGPGGGVCQVSTTLYHAAVRSGLEIVKRSKHTLKVAYVPLGQDATVDYGTKDFVFKNNTEYPIGLETGMDSKNVTITVYGRPIPDGENIQIVTEVLEETPAPDPEVIVISDPGNTIIPAGKDSVEKPASREGSKVKTWRVFMKEGKEVRRVGLYTDTYKTTVGTRYVRAESMAPAAPVQ